MIVSLETSNVLRGHEMPNGISLARQGSHPTNVACQGSALDPVAFEVTSRRWHHV